MPTMTYKTQSVTEHVMTDEQAGHILTEVANRVAAGQTDGVLIYTQEGVDVVRERRWTDQAAAEDWRNWVVNYSTQQGFSYSLFEVAPI
jgi:hypothetical protein